jgi:hypothetical protein
LQANAWAMLDALIYELDAGAFKGALSLVQC